MANLLLVYGFMLGLVLAVDAMVVGGIMGSVLLVVSGAGFFAGTSTLIYRKARIHLRRLSLVSDTGWRLGPGNEISNPDRPRRVNPVVIPESALALGFMAIGNPGSGKTVSVGVGYLQYKKKAFPQNGYAVIDGKGDIDYYSSLVRAGCKPDHFISSELDGSESMNILEGEAHDAADLCSRFLIGETKSTSFYSDEQKATLMKIIPIMKFVDNAHLRDLYAVITVNEAAMELLQRAKAAGIGLDTLSLARQFFDLDIDQRLALNKGLLNRLYPFIAGERADRYNVYQPDVSIARCMAKGESIFFHLPLSEVSVQVAIATVETFGVEARRRQLSGNVDATHFPLLFEDYGGFFHHNFGPISSRCRSAKMPLNFTFQSVAHLETVDNVFVHEMEDNIQTKIFLRVAGRRTAAFAVEVLDKYETIETSRSESGDRSSKTMTAKSADIIRTRDLRELNPGEAYVSTILKAGDKTRNPLYKCQFPSPVLDMTVDAALPTARRHEEGHGLGLWTKYMNTARAAVIQSQINEMRRAVVA